MKQRKRNCVYTSCAIQTTDEEGKRVCSFFDEGFSFLFPVLECVLNEVMFFRISVCMTEKVTLLNSLALFVTIITNTNRTQQRIIDTDHHRS
jgi:hypothetical protein